MFSKLFPNSKPENEDISFSQCRKLICENMIEEEDFQKGKGQRGTTITNFTN